MAEDKKVDVRLNLGMQTNKESVNQALDDAENLVNKRHIEINLEVAKKPIRGLEKEQKKILDLWKEVSEKGGLLSVPKKEANTFLDKYSKFSKQIGQSHQSNSAAYKELNRVIGKEIESYKNTFSEKNIKRAQTKWGNEAKARRTAIKETKQREKEDAKFERQLRRGTSAAKAKVPGSDVNLGYAKQAPTDKSIYTTEQTARLNEISEYSTSDPITEARKRKEIRKREKESLVLSDVETRSHRRGRPKKELKGTSAHSKITSEEQAGIFESQALTELQSFFAELEKGMKLSLTDMYKQLNITRKQLEDSFIKTSPKADITPETVKDAVNTKIIGAVQALYTQSMDKKIGFGNGGEQGVGRGHKRAQYMNQLLVDVLKAYNPYEDAKVTPQLQKLADMIENAADVMKKEDKLHKNSEWNQRRNELMAMGVDPKLLQAIFEVRSQAKATKDAVTTQTAVDKVGNVQEQTDNAKQTKILDEDSKTGGNTDEKMQEVTDAVKDIPKELSSENIPKKRTRKKSITTDNVTKEEANKNVSMTAVVSAIKTNLDGVMCPCQEILSAIYATIKEIVANGITVKKDSKKADTKEKEVTDSLPITLIPAEKTRFNLDEEQENKAYKSSSDKDLENRLEKEREELIMNHIKALQEVSSLSDIQKSLTPLQNIFSKIFPSSKILQSKFGPKASDIMNLNKEQQEMLLAQRRSMFGLVNNDNVTATGSKAQVQYRKSLYGRSEEPSCRERVFRAV